MVQFKIMYYLGTIIGYYPKQILIINFIVCLMFYSYFLIYPFKVQTDIRRGFAHRNGRSVKEFEVYIYFFFKLYLY